MLKIIILRFQARFQARFQKSKQSKYQGKNRVAPETFLTTKKSTKQLKHHISVTRKINEKLE